MKGLQFIVASRKPPLKYCRGEGPSFVIFAFCFCSFSEGALFRAGSGGRPLSPAFLSCSCCWQGTPAQGQGLACHSPCPGAAVGRVIACRGRVLGCLGPMFFMHGGIAPSGGVLVPFLDIVWRDAIRRHGKCPMQGMMLSLFSAERRQTRYLFALMCLSSRCFDRTHPTD